MPWVKKRQRKKPNRRTLLFYIGITLICILVSAGLALIIDKLPGCVQQLESDLTIRAIEDPGKAMDPAFMEDIRKTYEKNQDPAAFEKLKKTYEDALRKKDAAAIEELKRRHPEGMDAPELRKLKEAYETYRKKRP